MTTPVILPGPALARDPLRGAGQNAGTQTGTSIATGEEFAALVAGLLAAAPMPPGGTEATGAEAPTRRSEDLPADPSQMPGAGGGSDAVSLLCVAPLAPVPPSATLATTAAVPDEPPAGRATGATDRPAAHPAATIERGEVPNGIPVVSGSAESAAAAPADGPSRNVAPDLGPKGEAEARRIGVRAFDLTVPGRTEAPDSRPGHESVRASTAVAEPAQTRVPVVVTAAAAIQEIAILPPSLRPSSAVSDPDAGNSVPARPEAAATAGPPPRVDRPDAGASAAPAGTGTTTGTARDTDSAKVQPEWVLPTGTPSRVPNHSSDTTRAHGTGEAVAPTAPAVGHTPSAPVPTTVPSAPSAPASSPVATAAQLLAPVLAVHRRGVDGTHVMTIEVSPEHLGPVRLEIELRQGRIELRLAGDTEIARDALIAALPELRKALDSAGVLTGSLQVAAVAGDPGAAGAAGSDPFAASASSADQDGSEFARSHRSHDRPTGSAPDPTVPGTDPTPLSTGRSGLDLQL